MHAYTHTYMQRQQGRQRVFPTHFHACALSYIHTTHTHTHTQSHKNTCVHVYPTYTHTHPPTHPHTHTNYSAHLNVCALLDFARYNTVCVYIHINTYIYVHHTYFCTHLNVCALFDLAQHNGAVRVTPANHITDSDLDHITF
jgi:hypothetical protein